MSAARDALLALTDVLTSAAAPYGAASGRDHELDPAARSTLSVTPVALDRLGRSARDGPVLDLELGVRVLVGGPEALELTEALLTALERDARYTVEALRPGSDGLLRPEDGLGFCVRVRVPVRVEEPVGPPVRHPLRVELRPARSIAGTVVDADGAGVPGAVVRARGGGRPVIADADGRFRAMAVQGGADQEFVVQVQGTTRVVQAAAVTTPVVIRWD